LSLPEYPKDALDSGNTWLGIMGDFWRERFQQPEVLVGLLKWLEHTREQLDTDLEEAENSIAVDSIPALHHEWWTPITLSVAETGRLLEHGDGAIYDGIVGGDYVERKTFSYGIRSSSFSNRSLYALPENIVSIGALTDSPAAPSFYWVDGLDMTVYPDLGSVGLPYNLFEDERFADLVTVNDQGISQITLWAFSAHIDWDHVTTHAGHLLGMRDLPSTNAAVRMLSALWQSAVRGGARLKDVMDVVNALAGVSTPAGPETVEVITNDGDIAIVCTDVATYRLPAGSNPVVSVGDAVDVGSQLSDAVATSVASRAWYPWGPEALRDPTSPAPDPYVATFSAAPELPALQIPAVRITPSPAEVDSFLLVGDATERGPSRSSEFFSNVEAVQTNPRVPVEADTPVLRGVPVQQLTVADDQTVYDGISTADRPLSNAYVAIRASGGGETPRGLFDGLPAARGIMPPLSTADYVYYDPQTGAYYDYDTIAEDEAGRRGLERIYVGERGLTARYVFPDVIFGTGANATSGKYGDGSPDGSAGLPYAYDGVAPDSVAAADVWVTPAYPGFALLCSLRATSALEFPFTYRVDVSGGARITGVSVQTLAGDHPNHTGQMTATQVDASSWDITVYSQGTVKVDYQVVPKLTDTVDIANPPAALPIEDVAYRREYVGGLAPSETKGTLIADLVLPGGVDKSIADQMLLYRQRAADLLPDPVVTRSGRNRVLLVASHPSSNTTVLASTIRSATGYDVDIFYAWELRRGIANNVLRTTAGSPIRSFVDLAAAVRKGVRVVRYLPVDNKNRAVQEDCEYSMVVWDSAGGIADLPPAAQLAYSSGFAPGPIVRRLTKAADAYAWRAPDSARTAFEAAVASAQTRYAASLAAAKKADAAAVGQPDSSPLTEAAVAARKALQAAQKNLRRVERDYALDSRLWGFHGGILDVFKVASERNKGILLTGGTFARDFGVLAQNEQNYVLQLMGLRITSSDVVPGLQSAVLSRTPFELARDNYDFTLPTESGITVTDATAIVSSQAGGAIITANEDGLKRAALCNYRLVDVPTGYVPVAEAQETDVAPLSIKVSDILFSTG